ncbi:hypothetical protein DITRI_Ditri14bG0057400 [Diplodiscus trichospermus]
MGSQSINSSIRNMSILLWCANLLLVGWFPIAITRITINHDPLGVTSSRNSSVALCQWQGITCGLRHQRVTKLDGTPASLGSSTFGTTSVVSLPLKLVDFQHLKLYAGRNNLVGNIPDELGNLLKLEILHIAHNDLTGQLPTFLGNISTLQVIMLGSNNLHGKLLDTFGHLKRLVYVALDINNFSTLIPHSVFNLYSLEGLGLGGNQLSGSLPGTLGSNLPNLWNFVIAVNNPSESLVESLSNASKLIRMPPRRDPMNPSLAEMAENSRRAREENARLVDLMAQMTGMMQAQQEQLNLLR